MVEIGGAALSFAVDKLLEKVLDALKLVLNAPKNILKLQNLLERSQPSVKQLCNSVQGQSHPADKWLTELHKQLEMSHELVKNYDDTHRNIIRRYFTSKGSLEVYADIQALLKEASLHQWASGMFIRNVYSDRDAKMLSAIKTVLAEVEGLQKIADLSSNKSAILSLVSLLEQVFSIESSGEASSSTDPTPTLRTDRTCISKPEVTFGGEVVASDLINHLLNEECNKWVGLWGMGGIGKTFTDLINHLLNEECNKWVGLWGMGGIGKTFTARKVFRNSEVSKHFSGGTFWLTVSKDQASPNHLFRQLFQVVKGEKSVSQLPTDLGAAKLYLKNLLDRDRVLLVLDDVWQSPGQDDVLEYLDVISESKKGVILVTTRDQSVLRKVINSAEIFEIPRLSEKDSWKLFYHACCSHGRLVPLEVETVAKEMAAECWGLPLALEVIGSTMAGKELVPAEKAAGQTTLQVWERVRNQLKNANDAQDEYGALYLKLQLSVDSLPEHDARLQQCFFYFAAFPEDEHIEVEHLVRIWIGEGLVQGNSKLLLSAREESRVLLGVLAAKSMIKIFENGKFCKIHDVLRDLALRNLKRNISTGEVIEASARQCLYAPGWHQDKLPEEWIVSTTPSSAKRLSLQCNDLKRFPEPEQFCAQHLQVLLLSQNWILESLSPRFFQNLSNLRVLELSHTGIEEIPNALLWGLKSLVLLDLSYCEKLRKVSHKIDRLQSLEFLHLTYCTELQELSDNFDRLQTLKFLDLSGCHRLRKLPRVNNLMKLEIYYATTPTPNACDDPCNGSWLWQSCCPWRVPCGFVPYVLPPNLRKFVLEMRGKYLFDTSSLGHLEEFKMHGDEWACSIQSVLAGVMQWRQVKVLDFVSRFDYGKWLPSLGTLPFLEKLSITLEHDDDGMESDIQEGAFLSLKELHIDCIRSMIKIIFHPGTMPQIESLSLSIATREQIPASVVQLSSLKHLKIQGYGLDRGNEDLEFVFRHPDCFPHLESLIIFWPNINLPEHILDRQKQGLIIDRLTTGTFIDYSEDL